MKAMILAAGKGTRVRPLTYLVPKPMIPLLGRPLMEHIVDHLRHHGFDEIVVNTSYLARQIEDYFRDGGRHGVRMAYSFEGTLDHAGNVRDSALGSAGGLRRIQDFSGFFDDTFAVLCGDALIDVDLREAVRRHRASGAIATLVAKDVPRADVSSYGIVVAGADGRIQSFQEKPAPAEALSTLANTGIYLFEPAVFDFIPKGEVFDIGSQLFPALLRARAPFYAHELPFQWVDVGNTPDYWTATMRLLEGGIAGMAPSGREVAPGIFIGANVSLPRSLDAIRGPVWIGGSTAIGEGAVIEGPAAIGPGCVIEGGAQIRRSVVWDYTRVGGGATLSEVVVCGPYCVTGTGATIDIADAGLSWLIDDARRDVVPADEFGLVAFADAHGT